MSTDNTNSAPIHRVSYALVGITGHDFGVAVFSTGPKINPDNMSLSNEASITHEATLMLNPIAAKILAKNIQTSVDGYERVFGEIKLPENVGSPESARG
ncbi:DUF3467 domain-containing protein [Gluconobacter sphaericus]|uniref:DUF3467 domain-containing protein n=1 Tax=Gluconobacter sphaericus TaxID=574987 RepID=UPI001F3946EE|nr:DUF3467 domain-containing protein [Gluconobacter sphaericus]